MNDFCTAALILMMNIALIALGVFIGYFVL